MDVGTLTMYIKANMDQFEKSMSSVTKNIDAVQRKLNNFGTKMTVGVTLPIVGAASAAFKMAAELEDAMGATQQIYKSSSDDVKKWAKDLESYYGLATGEALSYVNTMGAMLQNIGGLTEKEAAQQGAKLVELAGDLSAMFGGTTEDAVRALTGSLKGNNTMLDNYGMAVNDAMVQTRAMEMGLKKEGEQLSLSAKQAATLSLIMEQTADAQGQAAREAEGASGSMKEFKAEVKRLSETFGEELLPQFTPIIRGVSDMINYFTSLDEGTKDLIIKIGLFAAAAGPVAKILSGVIDAFKLVKSSVTLASGAFNVAAGVMAPGGALVLGILAVAGVVYTLYKNWDKVTESVGKAVNKMKESGKAQLEKMGYAVAETPKIQPYIISKGRAFGGSVNAGESYLVGERGPEVVTMGGNGNVTPVGSGRQEVTHSGTITVRGVNNQGDLVAIFEKHISNNILQGDRRIPNRASILPI